MDETGTPLPTVEQVHAFVAKVNEGRVAFGLEPLTRIEYDECTPGNGSECLSARHLNVPVYAKAGGVPNVAPLVGVTSFRMPTRESAAQLIEALGTRRWLLRSAPTMVLIPDEILAVTNYFDESTTEQQRKLRAVFEEAGYLDA